jgi:hypothetical protein
MIYNLFELRSIKREQSADGKEEEKKGFGISKPEIQRISCTQNLAKDLRSRATGCPPPRKFGRTFVLMGRKFQEGGGNFGPRSYNN